MSKLDGMTFDDLIKFEHQTLAGSGGLLIAGGGRDCPSDARRARPLRTEGHIVPGILITESADDLPLILLDSVEAVIWRRSLPHTISDAARNFDSSAVDARQQARRSANYIDNGRYLLSERDGAYREQLKPLWEDRRMLLKAFRDNLRVAPSKTFLMVQKAFREGVPDNTFHRDYASGLGTQDERVVFMTVAHKGYGTEIIPAADAGRPTPFLPDNRSSFHHPKSLDRLFCAQAGDVMVMKSGRKGTVHRSPHKVGKGLRFWTFFNAGPISKFRKKFKPQELKDLRSRLEQCASA